MRGRQSVYYSLTQIQEKNAYADGIDDVSIPYASERPGKPRRLFNILGSKLGREPPDILDPWFQNDGYI